MNEPAIHIICGATASGKSSLALKTAEQRDGVIINADSVQLYKDLRILTACPSEEEEQSISHALYGILEAEESSSMARWVSYATQAIDAAHVEGKLPIVTGGTGLYISALLNGIVDFPKVTEDTREEATRQYDLLGKEAFRAELAKVDAPIAEKFCDKQRMIRAMSMYMQTGTPLSTWQQQPPTPFYKKTCFRVHWVNIEREELYRRCNERFVEMIAQGVLDEVARLKGKITGDMEAYPVTKALGFKELCAYLDGDISLEEAIAQAQQATRRYAKRQTTWFRNQLKIN